MVGAVGAGVKAGASSAAMVGGAAGIQRAGGNINNALIWLAPKGMAALATTNRLSTRLAPARRVSDQVQLMRGPSAAGKLRNRGDEQYFGIQADH